MKVDITEKECKWCKYTNCPSRIKGKACKKFSAHSDTDGRGYGTERSITEQKTVGEVSPKAREYVMGSERSIGLSGIL